MTHCGESGFPKPSEQGDVHPLYEGHVESRGCVGDHDSRLIRQAVYHGESCRLASGVVMMHSPMTIDHIRTGVYLTLEQQLSLCNLDTHHEIQFYRSPSRSAFHIRSATDDQEQ